MAKEEVYLVLMTVPIHGSPKAKAMKQTRSLKEEIKTLKVQVRDLKKTARSLEKERRLWMNGELQAKERVNELEKLLRSFVDQIDETGLVGDRGL